MSETVSAIHRVLAQGSSFPSVVETSSGKLRVMKLSGAGPGRRALATEYVALALARRLGLNVPDAMVLQLPPGLPWQVGTDEFYEAVERSVGANLGVAFIPEAADVKAAELGSLPEDFLDALGTIDALLQNFDRTEANPNVIRDRGGAHWAIDFGACLLIERLARGAMEPRLELPSNHFLARRAGFADGIRPFAAEIDNAYLGRIVAELPLLWLEDLGLSQTALAGRLTHYFDGLRQAR